MIARTNIFFLLVIFAGVFAITISSCDKEEKMTTPPASTTYNLVVKDVLGASGTVTFTETSSSVTTIEITLAGAASGTHPAHIHFNSAVETGGIAISLNPVDASGKSITVVTEMDNSSAINYAELIEFDGYINVHESAFNLGTIVAQGDIGGNLLVGTNKTYNLTMVDSLGVSGTALFEKRRNNSTLITLSLSGTLNGAVHPAHIHLGSVATIGGGPITASLNNVDGTTGSSYTNVRSLDDLTPITYDNWLVYDGYINVHQSPTDLASIICQGNIGPN